MHDICGENTDTFEGWVNSLIRYYLPPIHGRWAWKITGSDKITFYPYVCFSVDMTQAELEYTLPSPVVEMPVPEWVSGEDGSAADTTLMFRREALRAFRRFCESPWGTGR